MRRKLRKAKCLGVGLRLSGKKWLPDDGGDEYLWSEDLEKPQKHRRTPAKVALESPKYPGPQPRLSLRERAVELAKRNGTVRTKDLEAVGVPRQYPPMMCREGLLIRVGYGVYRAAAEGSRVEETSLSPMTENDKPSDFYPE
jgi:hypothetical protein